MTITGRFLPSAQTSHLVLRRRYWHNRTAYWVLPITYSDPRRRSCEVRRRHWVLRWSHSELRPAYWVPRSVSSGLRSAYWVVPIAYWEAPTAYWELRTAYWELRRRYWE